MVICRVEPLSYMLLHGLIELAFEAWTETNFGNEHPDIPYGPDWEGMQRAEKNHQFRLVAMRENEDLIGYTSISINIDAHNSLLITGTIRDIYVKAEKRGYAAQLVRYSEKLLPALGVKRVMIGERVHSNSNASEFYKALGYELREQIYGKTIH